MKKLGMAVAGVAGLIALIGFPSTVWSQGNIDPTEAFAWSKNAGWVNFAASNGGVTVKSAGLSGYAWAENLGWIKLAAEGSTYDNTTTNNWGVKLVGQDLQGFAWSKNAGWINFAPANGGVTIQGGGWFGGYAWGENVGWIHFRNVSPAYGVRTTGLGGTILLVK